MRFFLRSKTLKHIKKLSVYRSYVVLQRSFVVKIWICDAKNTDINVKRANSVYCRPFVGLYVRLTYTNHQGSHNMTKIDTFLLIYNIQFNDIGNG